jgi:hypothetical protein
MSSIEDLDRYLDLQFCVISRSNILFHLSLWFFSPAVELNMEHSTPLSPKAQNDVVDEILSKSQAAPAVSLP